MQVGVLTTNGGPHSTDSWALVTATLIIDSFVVKPDAPRKDEIEIAKTKAKARIIEIMAHHHDNVQRAERAILAQGDHSRLLAALDAVEHTDAEDAIGEIKQALQPILAIVYEAELVCPFTGLPKNDQTVTEFVHALVAHRVHSDLRSVMQIERHWHADRNMETDDARKYRGLDA